MASGQIIAFSRQQEREEKEEAILAEAARQFNSRGLVNTRLEDIAAALGVTKTNISYYFASKNDLVFACYERACELNEQLVKTAQSSGNAVARELLARYAEYWLGVVNRVNAPVVSFLDLSNWPDERRADIEKRADTVLRAFGESEDEETALARAYFLANQYFWLPSWIAEPHGLDNAELPAHFAGLVVEGLAAAPLVWGAPLRLIQPDQLNAGFDRKERNRLKREAFLKSGTRLFNRHAVKGVSLGEIASSLGVTRGALYYHFSDKDDLLDHCVERTLDVIETVLQTAEEEYETGLDRLAGALRALIEMQASDSEPLLRLRLIESLPEAERKRQQARLKRLVSQLRYFLRQGVSDGSIKDVDIALATHIVTGVLFLSADAPVQAHAKDLQWRMSEDPARAPQNYLAALFCGG